jgi:hypothetical protein
MALTKHSNSNTIFLMAKHNSLWQEVKKPVEGCDEVEVTNPRTGQVIKKHGFKFRNLTGRVTSLVKYDTEERYSTRYFGFKLHVKDGADSFVLDMPYQSSMLRRFLRIAPNVNWLLPLSITVFRGKKADGSEEMAIWFQQQGETVKAFYTKDHPNGMPTATQDPETKEWDFKPQHRWLVQKLKDEIIPAIDMAAAEPAPALEPTTEPDPSFDPGFDPYGGSGITDDDVPF